MWGAVEKWAYPQWTFPLLEARPYLTFGLAPEDFMVLAGFVEFAFAFHILTGLGLLRLGPDEIDAVLAHVKSRWPAGIRAYQAALDPGGGEALAALLRDPSWTFPGGCLTAPAEDAGL